MDHFVPISFSVKQQLLTQLCEGLDDAIFILDANLCYLFVNTTYEIMIGYKQSFLLGRPLGIYADEFLSAEERGVLKDINTRLDKHGVYENNFSIATRYDQILNCHMTYRRVYLEETIYYIGMLRDISSNIKDQQQVAHLLNYDQLTGLPNRKIFLSQATDTVMHSYQEVVIVRLNINRYRVLANSLGQDNVDTLIKAFSERLSGLKLNQLLCFSHFGSDDFGLLFEFNDANMVRHELNTIMQMCEEAFLLESSEMYLKISVGVSYFPENGNHLASLINKAEKALNYVQQRGGDNICWYSDELDNDLIDSLQLEAELRQAMSEGQFEPYYQPKIALETNTITGFEALVRWRHPTRGLLAPADFIDAVIKHKLSFALFCQMAHQIADQLSIWQAMGFNQHVCINADAAEFSHPEFFGFVSDLLNQYRIHPHQLHIEVTEASLMLRQANVKKQLLALKKMGICLALDDFGTGYASLSYLQEYPFDFIKVDKSFISKIAKDRTQYAIVKAILDLAVALDMSAISEGIETEEQRDLLLQMGCTYGQGYWFSQPVPADKATEMLMQVAFL